jgi:NTE family protein
MLFLASAFPEYYLLMKLMEVYSDGGILNHFPTDILQGQCETVIGVYVSPIQKN